MVIGELTVKITWRTVARAIVSILWSKLKRRMQKEKTLMQIWLTVAVIAAIEVLTAAIEGLIAVLFGA